MLSLPLKRQMAPKVCAIPKTRQADDLSRLGTAFGLHGSSFVPTGDKRRRLLMRPAAARRWASMAGMDIPDANFRKQKGTAPLWEPSLERIGEGLSFRKCPIGSHDVWLTPRISALFDLGQSARSDSRIPPSPACGSPPRACTSRHSPWACASGSRSPRRRSRSACCSRWSRRTGPAGSTGSSRPR